MSVLAAAGELNPAQLAEHVLTLSPFREVSQEQYRTFLHHLLAIDHLERTDTGTLILGLAGEKVVRTYRFLATFQDPIEWTVKEGSRSVGSLGGPVPVGERITLAGHTWVVTDLVTESRLILVTRLKGSVRTRFDGRGMGDVHDRIVERMRRALLEEADYPYLGDRARERLAEARALAHSTGIAEGPRVVPLGGHAYAVLPWAGTVVLRTLVAALTAAPGIRNAYADGLVLRCAIMSDRGADALTVLQQTVSERWEGARITAGLSPYQLRRAKYDEFLPESLLREAFAADALDPDRAQMLLKQALSALPPSPSLTAPT
jgi:ATP-dependent Lhr-like helicase